MVKEQICEYYKGCNMKEIQLRDCTKPAYENCETYKAWKESLELGIGVVVNLGDADFSTNAK